MSKPSRTTLSLNVLPAARLRVEHGANLGDALSVADDLVPDDTYGLSDGPMLSLSLIPDGAGQFRIAQDSATGTPGAALVLDSCLMMMSPDGRTSELLVLVELDEGHIGAIYALPLAGLASKTDYLLVGIERDAIAARLAQVACVSFSRGTHITLATGEQRRVEDLRVGDRILTRDDGPQELRWIGQSTIRAEGDLAPVRIAAGTLHNTGALVVSPDHRLFIYQRSDQLGAGRAEVLVRARHLVNGDSVRRQEGGFVDYFQLLFDRHQIIFAEGIATETLLLDDTTSPALPDDLAARLLDAGQHHDGRDHQDLEVGEAITSRADVVSLLRRATTG